MVADALKLFAASISVACSPFCTFSLVFAKSLLFKLCEKIINNVILRNDLAR